MCLPHASALLVASLLSSSSVDVVWRCSPPNSTQHLLLLRFLLHSDPYCLDHMTPPMVTPMPHGAISSHQDPNLYKANFMFYVDVFHKLSLLLCEEGAEELKKAHDYIVPSAQPRSDGLSLSEGSVKCECGGGAMSATSMDFIQVGHEHSNISLLLFDPLVHFISDPYLPCCSPTAL